MRLRFGLAMPPKGGRTALVGVEVLEGLDSAGRFEHQFLVGHVERISPGTVEAAAERVGSLMSNLVDARPCVLLDVGTAQGLALRQALRGRYPDTLHRPHAYPGTGDRRDLFSAFLQAYSTGRILFRPKLEHRADLDKALVNYMGGGVKKTGVELESEDEALVLALGLGLFWPRHGQKANKTKKPPAATDGQPAAE